METFRRDIEGNYLEGLKLVPEYADRIGSATRESRYLGMPVPNFYRQPYGPGWALVGDAGYDQDPCTAQGISNAFREAEKLADAWQDVRSGRLGYDDAMAGGSSLVGRGLLRLSVRAAGRRDLAAPLSERAIGIG